MELCSLPAIYLGPNYGGGNEDNGDLPQKVPCMYCYTQGRDRQRWEGDRGGGCKEHRLKGEMDTGICGQLTAEVPFQLCRGWGGMLKM